ncbi:hypothetical protein AAMO2058_000406800 [Amorphochlora amoebiformis]
MLLLVIVFAQAALFICSMLSPRLGLSFFGSNSLLCVLGIWMLETRNVRPAVLYLAILTFTIANDCICISLFGVSLCKNAKHNFSLASVTLPQTPNLASRL